MKTLQERSAVRDELVKRAKDLVPEKASKLFLSQYRSELEHLNEDDQVATHVPVGKDKFVEWVKNVLQTFFPEVSGVVENAPALKEYAVQIADLIGKSSSAVLNPMKDYVVNKDPVFIRANGNNIYTKTAADKKETSTPSGSLKTPNLFTSPAPHSRYCPDHPGAMMRRVSDNVYQCPVEGKLNTVEPWKNNYDYRGGHEVRFEMGVHNQTNQGINNVHPLLSFLSSESNESASHKTEPKKYDFEKLYGVKDLPADRQDSKNASESILNKLFKVAEEKACSTCGMKDCPCMKAGKECKCEPKLGRSSKTVKRAEDGRMSKSLIKNIIEMSTNIDRMIDPESDLEDWVDAKITKANEALQDVTTYLKNYEEGKPTPEGWSLVSSATVKIAKYDERIFAPTTMPSRQCPDHAGQQLIRVADGVKQCPLDHKIYDFVNGFTTADGVKHNGGSVQAQQSVPPGSVIIRSAASTVKRPETHIVAEAPTTHEFLYSLLQYLPASAERERKILNYKFQKGVTLEQAIQAVKAAEEMTAQSKLETMPPPSSSPAPAQAVATLRNFTRSVK